MKKSDPCGQSFISNLHKFVGLLAICFGALFSQNAQAAPLIEDHFNYTDGERLGNGTSAANWTGGSGLGSLSWTNRASAALSYSGLQGSSGIGVQLNIQPTSNRDRGTVFTPQTIDAANPSVYCSFLMNVASAPNGNKLIAYLRSDTGAGTPVAAIWLDSNMRLGITKSTDSTARIALMPGTVSSNTTHFIVARYHYVNGMTTGDTADGWYDPHPGTFNATEQNIPPPNLSTNFGSARNTVQSFVLANRVAGGTGGQLADISVDEVRVGRTWADVTPAVPGMATKLVFTSPAVASTTVNSTLTTLVAEVRDSFDTPVAQSGSPVTMSMLAGYGTLGGTVTRNTDGTGKATFNNLSINKVNAVVVLNANASGLYGTLSDLFSVSSSGGGGTPKSPKITQTLRTPSNIILRGNNGDAGQPFDVIASSTVNTPRSSWATLGSSTFDGSGNFDTTNSVSPGDAMKFYALKPTGTGSGGGGVEGPSGFATVGGITGGTGGPVKVVDSLVAFTAYAVSTDPIIMLVRSNITLGLVDADANFYLGPNKTLIGVGTNVTISGDLAIYGTASGSEVTIPATNIIIQNLRFTNPNMVGEGDGVGLKYGAHHVLVDHCTFIDCGDGEFDMTRESDFATVSWCKFSYSVTNFNAHPDVNLIGGNDGDTTDDDKLHVTFHHNWWSSWCRERMPSVRFGTAHVYNNYFNSPGNNYCTRARLQSEVLVENNYYKDVYNPWELATSSAGADGKIKCSGNITNNCIFDTTHYNANLPSGGVVILVPGTNDVFAPPYSYTMDPAADIASKVTGGAGAGAGPFAP